jgi:hypothetical protein
MITPLHPKLQKVSTEKLGAAFQEILYDNLWELYEQTPEQETYITAVQARELGVGKAEMLVFNDWLLCGVGCAYISNYMGEPLKYRAIKQAQPVSWNTKYSDSTPKLSVGNSAFEDWFQSQPFTTQTGIKQMCRDSYAAGMGDPLVTYVTTQAQPEPVREYDEAAFLKRFEQNLNRDNEDFFRVTEPADPHADNFAEESHPAYRALYDKQVKEGTTGFYLWELMTTTNPDVWQQKTTGDEPHWTATTQYRCTDISCYVSKDGEPAIRMLRTEAQELQAKLGDTVEWWAGTTKAFNGEDFTFNLRGTTYTYRTKATIKLDGRMVTPEQAAAEWKTKKETHDVWYRSDI